MRTCLTLEGEFWRNQRTNVFMETEKCTLAVDQGQEVKFQTHKWIYPVNCRHLDISVRHLNKAIY